MNINYKESNNKEDISKIENIGHGRRTIKTFVKHQGRITPGQKRAIELYSKYYIIPFQKKKLDNKLLKDFDNIVFEVGFGNGESMLEMAEKSPRTLFIGCEVHTPGVGHALINIHERGIKNVKCIMHDAVEVIENMIPESSLSRVQVYFPDPWHKKRHKKRRLISKFFCTHLKCILKNEGIIHVATDWQDYAFHTNDVFSEEPMFFVEHKTLLGINSRPNYRPITKFEKRGICLGHSIYDLIYKIYTMSKLQKKLLLVTYGCQMNEYDSQKIVDVLGEHFNIEQTKEAKEADFIILNTCSIREKAQEKVFSELGRFRRIKEKNPELIIAVGGCVASQEGEAIRKREPLVDIVFGPQTLHRLPNLINEAQNKTGKVVDISFPEIEKFDYLPAPKTSSCSAFVSIMEGCSKYCTYCVVPYTRGEEVSRPFDDVIAECAMLAAQGVREINLLGQNVNAYQGLMHDGDTCDLAFLIEVVAKIDGIDRIRFTTSHPVEFNERLIDVYSRVPQLVSHLHLPVQSGSDRILLEMKRGHTALEYKSKLRKIRKIRPKISFSSDFIVGFPGETEEDFEKTMQLIEDIYFDLSFSFIYSARPGTPAAAYPDNVSLKDKKRRLKVLQDRINEMTQEISKNMLKTEQNILVEGFSKRSDKQLSGRTENNRVVNFDFFPHSTNDLIGKFVKVKITDAYKNSLQGDIISIEETKPFISNLNEK